VARFAEKTSPARCVLDGAAMRTLLLVASVVTLAGCMGQTREATESPGYDKGATSSAAAASGGQVTSVCSDSRPVSESLAMTSNDVCHAAVTGRWQMCSGGSSLWNGAAGLELVDEGGAFRFYFLQSGGSGLVRDTSLPMHGRAELVATFDDKCDIILRGEDGKTDLYHRFQVWTGPDAMRDYVEGQFDFVKLQ
jgi:hypothetical protein